MELVFAVVIFSALGILLFLPPPGFCLLIDPVHNLCVLCTYELVIVLSLCGFGVFAILQTVTRFPNV
ncbi:MAG: hypothetical protein ACFFCJ_11520, partial [Promethearchaeota archaeon]